MKIVRNEYYTIKKDVVNDEDIKMPELEGIKVYTWEELNKMNNQ